MGNLIRNENMKLYRRPRTWVMVGLLIAAVLLGSIMTWYYDSKETESVGWRAEVAQDRKYFSEWLTSPNYDEREKNYAEDRIAIIDYQLANDVRSEDGRCGAASTALRS